MLVLICISLMVSDVGHLFMALFDICTSFPGQCLFMSFGYFLFFFNYQVSTVFNIF